jgi:glycosyltransferase involved in cell wall biosynthesis
MKLAFVVQRYGLEVNGGAELHCRQVAELLSKYFDVEVITTCAIDYMTWKNEYPPGKEVLNGLTIWRFPVDAPRDVPKFNRFSEKIFGKRHTKEDEIQWMKLQGPYSTKLFEFIEKNKEEYDYFIFFTYLYCTTFFGLPLVKKKAILVPTAHDEPPIYLDIFNSLFDTPAAIVYNTEEEKQFVNSKFNNTHILSDVVGVGIDTPKDIQPANFRQKYNIHNNFIIYMGRIDESKGCKELFDYFLRYKEEINSNSKLVLLGKPVMKIPKHKDIIPLGFVSEKDKFNGIGASELLIMPSIYESLSMVLMEALMCKKAVLVNGQCEVLKGHCLRSNAGLWYENYDEFKECLNLLLSNGELREKMGENGKKYVEENYSWENVEGKYLNLLAEIKPRLFHIHAV